MLAFLWFIAIKAAVAWCGVLGVLLLVVVGRALARSPHRRSSAIAFVATLLATFEGTVVAWGVTSLLTPTSDSDLGRTIDLGLRLSAAVLGGIAAGVVGLAVASSRRTAPSPSPSPSPQ